MFDTATSGELVATEPEIVAHVNADHAATVDLYAHASLDRKGDGWRLTGVDPDGVRAALINLAERVRNPAQSAA